MQTQVKASPEMIVIENTPQLDLMIVGGGPAGLTAALYALRANLKTLLVEKMVLGGTAITTYRIENYPGFPEGISGMELAQRLQEQVKKLGLEIIWGNAVSLENHKTYFEILVDGKLFNTKTIIIASGTEAAKLGVKGEDAFRGRGVSYCATCDGPFYKGKQVMVVGGGNAAVEEALFLTRFAQKVSVVHRRDELRADKILAEEAKHNPKIYFFWHSVVEEIVGKDKVEEVVLNDLRNNKKLKIPTDGIFIYVGSKPNSEVVRDLVKLDKNGFIISDEEMRTSLPGLFAAGDIRVKSLRQVVTAAADGAIAADSARKYLESKH